MHAVERETVVAGTAEQAWQAVLNADWLGEGATIDPRPDGEVSADGRKGFVEEVEPPRRLCFWWRAGEEEATRVEVELEEIEESTRIRVVESRPLAVLDAYGSDLGGAIGARGPQAMALA